MSGPRIVCGACGVVEVGIFSPLCERCKGRAHTDVVHRTENNAGSQAHLEANRAKLNRKCAEVLKLLEAGKRLTVLDCALNGIASLPRRILDLKQAGIPIADEWVGGYKVYFLAPRDEV